MKVNLNIRQGYTLIELLVGLTIIGILFAFGYVNFRDFSRRQAVAGIAKQIEGDLRLAQQQALSGLVPDDAKCRAPNNLLNGINFRVVTSGFGGTYAVEADCSGGIVSDPAIKSVTLPDAISISSTLNPIRFNVLGNGNNIQGGQNAVITILQQGTGNQKLITVTSGGEIK